MTVTAAAPTHHTEPRPAAGERIRWEIAGAAAAFAVLCAVALSTPWKFVEPDDYAYRAAIVALAHGHLTLANAQYLALRSHLSAVDGGGPGILQWVQHGGGWWMSEKNPGYPFFAVPFYALGIMRLAPLFYGALGCAGLFVGGRRWLGRWGGTAAVALFCTSGAAMVFAWRDYMPTFTGASLIAAGTGTLLWAILATEARSRRRVAAGLSAFLAFEGATFIRYSDVVVLAVAAAAVLAVRWRRSGMLPRWAVTWWLGSAVGAGVAMAAFNLAFYGSPIATGYRAGVITFSFGALGGNLRIMPAHLLDAMPMLVLSAVAVAWIAWRAVRSGRPPTTERGAIRRDLAVGASLAASWAAVWSFYAFYNWTATGRAGPTMHVVRFYVPALGAMSLLGAWLLVRLLRSGRLLRWAPAVLLAALLATGIWSAGSMRASGTGPAGGPPRGAGPLGGPGSGHFRQFPPGGLQGRGGGPPPGGGPGGGGLPGGGPGGR